MIFKLSTCRKLFFYNAKGTLSSLAEDVRAYSRTHIWSSIASLCSSILDLHEAKSHSRTQNYNITAGISVSALEPYLNCANRSLQKPFRLESWLLIHTIAFPLPLFIYNDLYGWSRMDLQMVTSDTEFRNWDSKVKSQQICHPKNQLFFGITESAYLSTESSSAKQIQEIFVMQYINSY